MTCSIRVLLSILIFGAGAAAAQLPTALVVEGQSLPGAPPGHVISSISNSGVNHSGGYAFTLNSLFETATISQVWGSADGGPGGIIMSEDSFGVYDQTSYESFFGFSDAGQAIYSPSCNNSDTGEEGLDCLWIDEVPVAVEGQPVAAAPGYYFSFNSRPGCYADGTPIWVGGLTDTPGGGTQIRALFKGDLADILLMGGDFLPGLPWAIGASSIDFDFRSSALGSHYICPVNLDTGSTSNDGYVVIDGEALQIAGSYVAELTPVPEEAGGLPGENWDNFDFCGINDSCGYMLTGDTDGSTSSDEFVLLNGSIALREGDTVGGLVLTGSIEGAYLNENGDYAVIWDVDDGTGTILEALIVNGELVLLEGESVDLDGDGELDPDIHIDNFTGISSLTLGDRDEDGHALVAFTADVEVPDPPMPVSAALPVDLDEAGLEEAMAGDREDRAVVEAGFIIELTIATDVGEAPMAGHLAANYPNPFNPGTRIDYRLSTSGPVRLEIITVEGRLVTLLEDGFMEAGEHSVLWDGRNAKGRPVASGVYYYRIQAGDWSRTRSMVLIK